MGKDIVFKYVSYGDWQQRAVRIAAIDEVNVIKDTWHELVPQEDRTYNLQIITRSGRELLVTYSNLDGRFKAYEDLVALLKKG